VFIVCKFCTTEESFSTGTVNKHPGITPLLSYSKYQVEVSLAYCSPWQEQVSGASLTFCKTSVLMALKNTLFKDQ